jgi:hypothetical protein
MMRSTVTQVAVAILAISMFICNSESAKSFDNIADDVRVRIEVKIPDEGSSAAGPVEEVFIAGNIKQLGAWRPNGLKLDRTKANVFGAEFSVPAGTRMQFKVIRTLPSMSMTSHSSNRASPNRTITCRPYIK